ncbi:3-oxoadipate enol-lactonase [Rhizobium rhizosphaerae]|uniref:3-oxoadipate enol-lactonase n=1 Tax=Xaviernesmea rhizosphaerae TaxID=1672749 RepID=A0ABX3PE28_9HYPH|nr:3-oxoadipate enol-lactonase [Xaviernesmea rhizosphaerae]OQP86697.1 3-oxoadipate enol-lactonase [Xaviernesmea rhizosphaerae]
MDFMQIGDAAIHYRAVGLDGRRPVIAFINSLGTDFRIWDAVVERLSGTYGIVLHDKRGHGLSPAGSEPISIERHAADLLALLDHLGVARAVFCGLSVGGQIAQSIAATAPERVRALILSNTAPKIGTAESWAARIAAIKAEGLPALVEPVMERWFTPAFRRADNPLYAGARTMLAQQNEAGYAATCAAIRDADYTKAAGRIAVPTLCIAGAGDGSTPPDLVRAMAARIPGSRFVEIPSCGHIPCLEQPAAHAAALTDFLAGLPEH